MKMRSTFFAFVLGIVFGVGACGSQDAKPSEDSPPAKLLSSKEVAQVGDASPEVQKLVAALEAQGFVFNKAAPEVHPGRVPFTYAYLLEGKRSDGTPAHMYSVVDRYGKLAVAFATTGAFGHTWHWMDGEQVQSHERGSAAFLDRVRGHFGPTAGTAANVGAARSAQSLPEQPSNHQKPPSCADWQIGTDDAGCAACIGCTASAATCVAERIGDREGTANSLAWTLLRALDQNAILNEAETWWGVQPADYVVRYNLLIGRTAGTVNEQLGTLRKARDMLASGTLSIGDKIGVVQDVLTAEMTLMHAAVERVNSILNGVGTYVPPAGVIFSEEVFQEALSHFQDDFVTLTSRDPLFVNADDLIPEIDRFLEKYDAAELDQSYDRLADFVGSLGPDDSLESVLYEYSDSVLEELETFTAKAGAADGKGSPAFQMACAGRCGMPRCTVTGFSKCYEGKQGSLVEMNKYEWSLTTSEIVPGGAWTGCPTASPCVPDACHRWDCAESKYLATEADANICPL